MEGSGIPIFPFFSSLSDFDEETRTTTKQEIQPIKNLYLKKRIQTSTTESELNEEFKKPETLYPFKLQQNGFSSLYNSEMKPSEGLNNPPNLHR